ncbi:AraC family transcriptional regulator [Agrobacterium cavarae]
MQNLSTTGVIDIALSCCLSSGQYFSNTFKKRFGYSPSRCRRL